MAWAESSTAVTVRQYRGFRQGWIAYSGVGEEPSVSLLSIRWQLLPVNTTQHEH